MRPFASTAASLAILAGLGLAFAAPPTPSQAFVGVGISVGFAPPPLPVYVQPPIPAPGYIWTPGYWGWNNRYGDYYWVPGTWVEPPRYGLLWTPGYWGWNDGAYLFFPGYWGPFVGFYGGIDYGFGYPGFGFFGGEWRGNSFFYNSAVNNFGSARISNTFSRPVTGAVGPRGASFNGGAGGVRAAASAQQTAARRGAIGATAAQTRNQRLASQTTAMRASVNHGRPTVAATSRAGAFRGSGVSGATNAANFSRPAGAAVVHGAAASRVASTRTGTALWTAGAAVTHGASASRVASSRTATTRTTTSRVASASRQSHVPSTRSAATSRSGPTRSASQFRAASAGPRIRAVPEWPAPGWRGRVWPDRWPRRAVAPRPAPAAASRGVGTAVRAAGIGPRDIDHPRQDLSNGRPGVRPAAPVFALTR